MRDNRAWGIIAAPYERTTSCYTGAALGPDAVLRELEKTVPAGRLPRRIDRIAEGALATPRSMIGAVAAAVSGQVAEGLLPVMLGGEHTCTLGPVTALKGLYPELGIVHLDAHADERSRYGGTRYSHASVMRRITADLSLPALSIGVRALSAAEARYMAAQGIGLLPAEHLNEWEEFLPALLDRLPPTVYLTVDMDFFDPAVVPGVGTPEPGGAQWREASGIIGAVTAGRFLAGFDIVELCPPRERERSVPAALKTLLTILHGARSAALDALFDRP